MYTEVLVLVKQRTGQYLDGYKVTEIDSLVKIIFKGFSFMVSTFSMLWRPTFYTSGPGMNT